MANVGSGDSGKTLIGTGNGKSPTYASIGTNSGLTAHGVVIAEGTGSFTATAAGTSGQVLTSNGAILDPTFQSISSLGAITTVTGNSGGAESPSAGNFNILGTGSITSVGTANTETVQLTGLTNHNVLIGAGTATITKVAPSATSGIPLISNGSVADPSFGVATVPGGGTGNDNFPSHSILIGNLTSPVGVLIPGASGTLVQSIGASSDPAYTTAAYPAGAGTSGNVITSNGTNFVSQALPNTTLTNHSIALGTGTSDLSSVGPSATSGAILQSAGAAADPTFSTASYPSTASTSGNVITSNGTNFVSQALPSFPTTTLTNHSVALGTGTANLSSVGPGATSGVALISQGAAADPAFGTVLIAGGGVGFTTYATGDIIYASSANTLSKLTAGSNTQILTLAAGVPTWAPPATSGTVTSVSGTTNRITSTGGATPVIDISASYVGQSSITTLGTIATGTWNATTIAVTVGGTGRASLTNHGVLVGAGTSAITQLAAGTAGQVLQSGGASADPAYSTAAYPLTAGTSGKVLISDGTNIVSSTPTFPNASASSGKFIQSDGTNWIASTPTLPTSAGTSGKVLQSNGTNYVESTPTYPSASGTSGKILVSDGTNNVYSTPTFPNASASSGKFIRSDGTNWIASTPTLPTSAGTSGKILQSNGTNYVESTPTYPSTSGSSGKILISDGTNNIYSTPTFPNAAGTSGNVLTSDGTNFTSSALPSKASMASVGLSTTISNVTGDGTLYFPIIFDTKLADVGTNYSTVTGNFTAPTTGNYLINANITFTGATSLYTSGEIRIIIAGSTFTRFIFNPAVDAVSGVISFAVSLVAALTATNTVSIGALISGSTKSVGIQGNSSGYQSTASFIFLG